MKKQEDCSDTQPIVSHPRKMEYLDSFQLSKYYKNRAYLFTWNRRECVKFCFYKQTFANIINLLDRYFKVNPFDQGTFIPIALSAMIISSKAFEKRVLYTRSVAAKNKLDFDYLLGMEMKMLDFFKFRVTSYNFVRVVNEYLKRWNEQVGNAWEGAKLIFYGESLESYLLYEEMYFICEEFLKQRKFLREETIEKILKLVISSRCKEPQSLQTINKIISQIFRERVYSLEQENDNIFQAKEKDPQQQQQDLLKLQCFFVSTMAPKLEQRYCSLRCPQQYQTFEQFLAHLT